MPSFTNVGKGHTWRRVQAKEKANDQGVYGAYIGTWQVGRWAIQVL